MPSTPENEGSPGLARTQRRGVPRPGAAPLGGAATRSGRSDAPGSALGTGLPGPSAGGWEKLVTGALTRSLATVGARRPGDGGGTRRRVADGGGGVTFIRDRDGGEQARPGARGTWEGRGRTGGWGLLGTRKPFAGRLEPHRGRGRACQGENFRQELPTQGERESWRGGGRGEGERERGERLETSP